MQFVSLKKYKNGREYWQCSFSLPNHRRIRHSLGTTDKISKTQAEQLAKKKYRDELDNFTGINNHRIILSKAVEIFFDTLKSSPGLIYKRRGVKNVSNRYVIRYQQSFSLVVKYFGNHRDLCSITREHVEEMIHHYTQSHSASTINKVLIALRQLNNLLIVKGVIKTDFMQKIRVLPVDNERITTFSEKQVQALIANAPEYLRNLIYIASESGLRKSELLGLTWGAVDFQRKVIHLDETKAGKYQRQPLSDSVINYLREMKLKDPDSGCDGAVFKRNGQPILEFKKGFNSLMKRLDIKGQDFHSLRHYFVTHLVKAGVDPFIIQKLARHANIQTTLRYTHLGEDAMFSALNGSFGSNLACTKKQSV